MLRAGSHRMAAHAKTQSIVGPPEAFQIQNSRFKRRGVATLIDSPNAESAERRLMERVMANCDGAIREACAMKGPPPAFLAALVANESGGERLARRFEPGVYGHLEAVWRGERPNYGAITRAVLETEIRNQRPSSGNGNRNSEAGRQESEVRSQETEEGRQQSFVPGPSSLAGSEGQRTNDQGEDAGQRTALQPKLRTVAGGQRPPLQPDAILRALATSWRYTQIMGYHAIGSSEFGVWCCKAGSQKPEVRSQRQEVGSEEFGVRSSESAGQRSEAGGQRPALQPDQGHDGGQRPPLQPPPDLEPRFVAWLLDPDCHFHLALDLLAEFARQFKLNPARDFAELFHCWNTGQPYGPPRGPATYDPRYVENGMRRIAIYRGLERTEIS